MNPQNCSDLINPSIEKLNFENTQHQVCPRDSYMQLDQIQDLYTECSSLNFTRSVIRRQHARQHYGEAASGSSFYEDASPRLVPRLLGVFDCRGRGFSGRLQGLLGLPTTIALKIEQPVFYEWDGYNARYILVQVLLAPYIPILSCSTCGYFMDTTALLFDR